MSKGFKTLAEYDDLHNNGKAILLKMEWKALPHMPVWFCGYVGVKPGHWAYQKHYDEVCVECPGGLTYSDFKSNYPDLWFLGFDTAHFGMENMTEAEAMAALEKLAIELSQPPIEVQKWTKNE